MATKTKGKTPDASAQYPWIWAWGQMLGSNGDYIARECEKALAAGAPSNAIFWSVDEKRWSTTDDIHDMQVRYRLKLPPVIPGMIAKAERTLADPELRAKLTTYDIQTRNSVNAAVDWAIEVYLRAKLPLPKVLDGEVKDWTS